MNTLPKPVPNGQILLMKGNTMPSPQVAPSSRSKPEYRSVTQREGQTMPSHRRVETSRDFRGRGESFLTILLHAFSMSGA